MNFVFSAQNSQRISGPIKSDINIVRIVSGLFLKISCYPIEGNYVGSCVKNDFCQALKWRLDFSTENCPEFLLNNNIDCACPFNIPAGRIDIKTDFVLDFSMSPLVWAKSGDFSVDIKLTQGLTSILCLNIKFAIKPILN